MHFKTKLLWRPLFHGGWLLSMGGTTMLHTICRTFRSLHEVVEYFVDVVFCPHDLLIMFLFYCQRLPCMPFLEFEYILDHINLSQFLKTSVKIVFHSLLWTWLWYLKIIIARFCIWFIYLEYLKINEMTRSIYCLRLLIGTRVFMLIVTFMGSRNT